MKAVFVIAVFGLISSAVAHFSTFLGVNPRPVFPLVWALGALLIVVWTTVVLWLRRICTADNQMDIWKIATRNAPAWMKVLLIAFVAYGIFSFFFTVFVLTEGGVASERDGRKVLESHGEIIRTLTDEEYETHHAYTVRIFSGHFMIFYAVGTTVLFSRLKEESSQERWSRRPRRRVEFCSVACMAL